MKGSETARPTARTAQRSAWELADLIRPLRHSSPKRRSKKPLPPFAADVVAWVHERRFATGQQIAKRFPEWFTSQRTTQRRLAEWVAAGVLNLATVRGTCPIFPHVYVATSRGIRLVQESREGSEWPSHPVEQNKPRGRAIISVLHKVMATEFELMVEQTIAARPDLQLLMSERRYNRRKHRLKYEQDGKICFVEPDIGLLVAGERTVPILMFVEIDAGTIPVRRIYNQKLERYHQWLESEESDKYLDGIRERYRLENCPSVRWLWVANDKDIAGRDEKRLVDVLTEALQLPTMTRERLWLTTASGISPSQQDSATLTAPIWVRARHARPWIRTFWDTTNSLKGSAARKAKQREFVRQRVMGMPRRSLFWQMKN